MLVNGRVGTNNGVGSSKCGSKWVRMEDLWWWQGFDIADGGGKILLLFPLPFYPWFVSC